MSTSVYVNLGMRSYDIVIGQGLISKAGTLIADRVNCTRAIIVTDTNAGPLYAPALESALDAAGITHNKITLPAGEQTKSFAGIQQLLDSLLSLAPDRRTKIVALGGGVIGDIAGFAASILLRGVDFIQIPTTLLAQVDSSVGGKTGINAAQGKNLIGSFHQPRLVIADTSVLSTLPTRETLAGYAEVVKYGVIGDYELFEWLEEHGAQALGGEPQALEHVVRESCRAKAAVVGQDERESSLRAILNFGHTLGHALEAETGFSVTLLHGEAVAIGMVLALKLSVKRGLFSEDDCDRVVRHLKAVGFKTRATEVKRTWDAARLIEHCYHDKKAFGGNLTFVLAERIGKVSVFHDIEREELESLLALEL